MGFFETQYLRFRNLDDIKLKLDAPEVFLIGENGQGKSNFVESIYLLCFGSSFRTRQDDRMIQSQQREAVVLGSFSAEDGRRRKVAVKIARHGKKEIRVDGKFIYDRKDLIENIPCILFCPQDMEFVNGVPEIRRRFFNQTLSLFDPLFINQLRIYRKILKSRNILLKEHNPQLLETYNYRLAGVGWQIQQERAGIIAAFNQDFSPLFSRISGLGEEVRFIYLPSWKDCSSETEIVRTLEKRLSKDLQYETTTSGPHRDLFRLMQGEKDFAFFGSTGQIRLVTLVLRVAQARFFQKQTGKKPILLFDDVLLELDAGRRERFLACLPEYEQAFFTFLPEEPYFQYKRDETLVYRVKEGSFQVE